MPRLSELAEITPIAPRDRFVGRERERSEFRNSARYLLEKEVPPGGSPLYPHIFLPHGEGGMGKSALLRQFVRIARDEGLPEAQIILLDLDSDSYPTIEALAQKLAAAVRRVSPEFDQRYRTARIRRDQLASQVHELKERWQRWETWRGTSDVDLDQLIDVHRRTLMHNEIQQARFGTASLPHMEAQAYESHSELAALLAFRQEPGRVPASFDELLERELGLDDAALFVQTRGLGMALADDLCALAESAPLLLALDTYELADQHDDWLRMTILAGGSSRMLTIIAGRNRHDDDYRRTFAGALASLVRSYDLNHQTLQLDEIREYLRLRIEAEPDDTIVEEVLQISRGIPLAVEALGDQLADTGDIALYRGLQSEGLDLRGVVHRVTQRFLRYALDAKSDVDASRDAKREDRQRIRALSLLLRPDAELACALWGCPHAEAQRVVGQLADRHSFIFAGFAPYELHDLVREFVRANTLAEGRNAFDWPALDAGLRRALAITEQRIARANARIADLDERYDDAEWRDATLDRLNLLLWLGEDEAAKHLLLNRWIEARHANKEFAQELFALADELAPQRKDWLKLVVIMRGAEYERIEPYHEMMESHANVVLYYLRAGKVGNDWLLNDDELEQISRNIILLKQGYAHNDRWKPISRALAESYARRGVYMSRRQKIVEALIDYDYSLALYPNQANIFHYRGLAKIELGDYTDALADYNQSLMLRPNHDATLHHRAIVKMNLGDYTGALADIDRSLELRPDVPSILHNRGWMKSKLGDNTGALADYNRSLELRPDHAPTLQHRGLVKMNLGDYTGALADYKRALTDYKRALELRPDHPNTMYCLACLYALQNHTDTALDWLAKAIAGEEKYRIEARTDTDFDAIRADPRFAALVGNYEETGS